MEIWPWSTSAATADYLAGSGRLWVLRKQDGKWLVQPGAIGPIWVSRRYPSPTDWTVGTRGLLADVRPGFPELQE